MKRTLILLPLLALGPLTGPLTMGVARYARRRRWGMAAVCALGLAEVWLGLPAILAGELGILAHRL